MQGFGDYVGVVGDVIICVEGFVQWCYNWDFVVVEGWVLCNKIGFGFYNILCGDVDFLYFGCWDFCVFEECMNGCD